MRKILLASLFTSFSAFSAPAQAQDNDIPGTFSANISLASEYSFRGITQSDENPAFQGGVDWAHDNGAYLGFWGSNVDFNDGDEASVEVDFYGGMRGALTEQWSWDAGLIYYAYPGADSGLDYDYVEAMLKLSYAYDDLFTTAASINYSPDFFASSDDAFYYKLALDVPLSHGFGLSALAAYQAIDDEDAFGYPDYFEWGLGASYTYDLVKFSLQYVGTDIDHDDCADGCEDRLIGSMTFTF